MAWGFQELFEQMGDQFKNLFEQISEETRDGGLAALITPVDPFNRSDWLTPLIGAAAMISVLLLSGLVVGSLAVALSGFLALCFVLAEVFGYEMTFAMPAAP
jgi:hypothetical protein